MTTVVDTLTIEIRHLRKAVSELKKDNGELKNEVENLKIKNSIMRGKMEIILENECEEYLKSKQ
jgi:predicted RNase H-like nuclease (RuvC/YqgF family)